MIDPIYYQDLRIMHAHHIFVVLLPSKRITMNQNKYNRKMRLFLNKIPASPSTQKQMLTSTQMNISKFQRSKHEIYSKISRRQFSSKKIKSILNKSFIQAINQTNPQFQSPSKNLPPNLHNKVSISRNPYKKSSSIEQSKLKKGNIRQVMLIDRDNFKKQDSFPLIYAKKFTIKKVDKRFKNIGMNVVQQTTARHKYYSIFQPWQSNDQFAQFARF